MNVENSAQGLSVGLRVLSLFDGMSCGRIALDRAGIPVSKYYASEIDKYAMKVSAKNYPDIVQLGDVREVNPAQLEPIDLLLGGSPCQGFSFAGKRLNFDDPRSKLFFEYVRVARSAAPKYFLLENVLMKQECIDVISEQLGVEPIMINSSLVSAQNRKRLYWTNIPSVFPPEDKGIVLRDILEPEPVDDRYYAGLKLQQGYRGGDQLNPSYRSQQNTIYDLDDKSATFCAGTHGYCMGYVPVPRQITSPDGLVLAGHADNINGHDILKRVYSAEGKSPTLNTCSGGNREPKIVQVARGKNAGGIKAQDGKTPTMTINAWEHNNHLTFDEGLTWRKLTPRECELLQTVPIDYTEGVSNTQRYKMLGNGWTVDVIAHIFKYLKATLTEELHNEERKRLAS
jgi:DNA (cytosine-5)-methyltransferase 3A